FLRQVARARADHDAELDLVVELGRAFGGDGVVVRAEDAGRRLVEDDRLLRDRHAGFRRMVRVIQPDGDQIADPADARADPRLALDDWQPAGRGLLDLREASWRQGIAGKVGHDFREIADVSLCVDDAGFFAAGRAEADELHGSGLLTTHFSGWVAGKGK